ncbi:MAG: fumarylacetoacetase [Acidobacteriia bacterium]|nr:fumarylacetoacetase [Terriglobia bacterium]
MDPTNDPGLRSFVDVPEGSDFPIQNLPYGVFRPREGGPARPGARIGDLVLDLRGLEEAGGFDRCAHLPRGTFAATDLNGFLALGRPAWREARETLSRLLRAGEPRSAGDGALRERLLVPVAGIEALLPARIGDYTDFYSSKEHATNVGIMLRGKDNALMPNWVHLPVAYHGRASSVVPSGTPVRRPRGQVKPDDATVPLLLPTRQLDFELEVGFLVGPGNDLGRPIPVAEARAHVLGLVLVDDWSARDVQRWEYQPLGPFNSKNFATTISPWIVTLDALEPFRCAGPRQDPEPLPYLREDSDGAYDIRLEVRLGSREMEAPATICRSNTRYLYWSIAQQLAHHTITGCNVRPGDLMASGTISGPDEGSRGSLLELAWRGTKPISLGGGGARTFLEDGDTVEIAGGCEGNGYRIGFGECRGTVLPALE